jgi:uncharacterized protein
LLQFVDRLGSEEMLLFATDYPHWHDDTPDPVVPASLSAGLARKMLYDNAATLYRL